MTGRSVRRWLALLTVLTMTVGCAGLPTSSEPSVVQVIDEPQAAPSPQAPQPGQPADQIVRDFIEVSASVGRDGESDAAARQYLTSVGSTSWQRDTTTVVVLRDDFRTRQTEDGQVELRGVQVAELDADRAYHPVPNETYELTLHLQEVDGEWRIDDPPRQLVITQSEFQTAYFDRVVYFLNSTGDVLVPDYRYITIGSTPELQANRLVNLLLSGPSTTLTDAATSRLGAADLQSNVKLDANENVQVDLTGVTLRTQQDRLGLAAQLAWTLQSVASGVVITVDGRPLDEGIEVFTTQNTESFSPDRRPGTGNLTLDQYYIDSRGRIINLTTGTAMWGQWGHSGGTESAAMSAANGTVAAVSADDDGSGGRQLLIGRPLDRTANPESVLKADSITTPSFDRAGNEVWVVQDGATKPQVIRFTATPPITRQVVSAPGLADLGEVTSLVLSPDSTRVAVVADENLYVGVIVSSVTPEGVSSLAIEGLQEIDSGLTAVGPVAFLSATQLLVGAKVGSSGAGFRVVHQISIDGQDRRPVTETGIYGDVSSIAVGSSNGTVLISVDDRVWQLSGSLRTGEWKSPDPEVAAVNGIAPFVPN